MPGFGLTLCYEWSMGISSPGKLRDSEFACVSRESTASGYFFSLARASSLASFQPLRASRLASRSSWPAFFAARRVS